MHVARPCCFVEIAVADPFSTFVTWSRKTNVSDSLRICCRFARCSTRPYSLDPRSMGNDELAFARSLDCCGVADCCGYPRPSPWSLWTARLAVASLSCVVWLWVPSCLFILVDSLRFAGDKFVHLTNSSVQKNAELPQLPFAGGRSCVPQSGSCQPLVHRSLPVCFMSLLAMLLSLPVRRPLSGFAVRHSCASPLLLQLTVIRRRAWRVQAVTGQPATAHARSGHRRQRVRFCVFACRACASPRSPRRGLPRHCCLCFGWRRFVERSPVCAHRAARLLLTS